MKKFRIILLFILLLLPAISLAQSSAGGQFVPLAPIPGLTDQQPQSNMAVFLNNLYKILIGVAAAAAVVMIIWGGLEYATTDNISSKSEGKAKIQQAILGLILVLLPVLVFSIINPSILNLSVNWQTIALPSGTGSNNSSDGNASAPAAPATGCNTGANGPYLQTAVCATSADATNHSCSNNLTQKITEQCSGTKNPDGSCKSGESFTVVCSASTVATYYTFSNQSGVFGNYRWVVPSSISGTPNVTQGPTQSSAAATQTFIAGCASSGGKLQEAPTLLQGRFVLNYNFYGGFYGSSCSDTDFKMITVPSNKAAALCYETTLTCVPN
jgi:hypothetical protein